MSEQSERRTAPVSDMVLIDTFEATDWALCRVANETGGWLGWRAWRATDVGSEGFDAPTLRQVMQKALGLHV